MCDKTARPGVWRAWLTLFRPPNLFTAPGDPLVGAMLASGTLGLLPQWHLIGATLGAALLFYAAGLLANDFFDRSIDALERPDRPIPSGAVSPFTVLAVAVALTLAGILLLVLAGRPAFVMGLLLAGASWFYNSTGKRVGWLAPLSMGLCRGLSLWMGACTFGFQGAMTTDVLVSVVALTLFIALITGFARDEAASSRSAIPLWRIGRLPILLAAWLAFILLRSPHTAPLAFILAAMSLVWVVVWVIQIKPSASPQQIQSAIGGLIRGLILTQAALCASTGSEGQGAALLLLAAFPVSGWLGRWFYGS
ncbi:MAG: UbiA family prenyltransferase [bacterium]